MQRGSRSHANHIVLITIFRQCLVCKMTERLEAGQRSWNATLQPPYYSLTLWDLPVFVGSASRLSFVQVWERCWAMLSCHRGALSGRAQHRGQGCRIGAQSACCVPLCVWPRHDSVIRPSTMALMYLKRGLRCKYTILQVFSRSNGGVLTVA